jgi:hypothetical protein
MSELEILLEHKGTVVFETIDPLLERLRKLPACLELDRSVQKRIYSIFVECLENIYRHTNTDSLYGNDKNMEPYIFLGKQNEKYIIGSGNVILNKGINKLKNRLEHINQLDRAGLKASYADIINKESVSDDDGAGLGLIITALHAKNEMKYNFTSLNDQYSYFELKITI